ncbi:MAG: ATP-binding protein [Mollicutes bacterium UO1]
MKSLKGFDPSRKGKIMSYDKEGYLGIKDYSNYTMQGEEGEGVLRFDPQTLTFFERVLKDIDDFLDNGTMVDSDPGFEGDNYEPFLVRNNCILYGAPGTGKTEFVRELNRMLIEKHSPPSELITDPNDPRYGLANSEAQIKSVVPIFEINGERLQTGGQTMKDLNTHEKLAEIIKVLKQETFGDTFSKKPYIVFVDEADQARNTMAGDKAALLEEWKNFLSSASDSEGLGEDGVDAINPAQDRNSIFIVATNNYEGIDAAIKRRGRLGKRFNFT